MAMVSLRLGKSWFESWLWT